MTHIEKKHHGVAGPFDLAIFCFAIIAYIVVLTHPDYFDHKQAQSTQNGMLISKFEQVEN